jgi:hypothetical protein
MVYLSVAGNHIIFVNNFDMCVELFEKRSALYSDRMQSSMMEL